MLRHLGLLTATALIALANLLAVVDAASARPFDLTTSFGTKTAYWDQINDPLHLGKYNRPLPTPKEEAKYTLVQIQSVVRHGTRFPTKGNIQEIQALVAKLQTNYGSVIPKWLQNYTVPYDLSIEGTLAPTGMADAAAYGKRVRQSLAGTAIPTSYAADQFILQHTYKSRTKATAQGFASMFFENPSNVTYVGHPKDSDRLLRFFDECDRFVADVDKNENASIEATTFKASPMFQQNIETLRKALDLPQDAPLTTVDVESAFSACAFDLSLYKTDAQWCTLLNEQFIKTAEYAEDLETFYESSAGYKISYETSAVLLQDVVKFMKDHIMGKTPVVGNFRFAHAETTTPLITLLGYADKTPLVGNATSAMIEHRKFRGSRLSTTLANIEVRLYEKNEKTTKGDADDNDDSKKKPKYYVQIRLNEQATAVPGCDGEVFCKLSEIEKIWKHSLTEYDFDAECKI